MSGSDDGRHGRQHDHHEVPGPLDDPENLNVFLPTARDRLVEILLADRYPLHIAEDAAHEAVEQALTRRKPAGAWRAAGIREPMAWLTTTARHVAQKRATLQRRETPPDQAVDSSDPDDVRRPDSRRRRGRSRRRPEPADLAWFRDIVLDDLTASLLKVGFSRDAAREGRRAAHAAATERTATHGTWISEPRTPRREYWQRAYTVAFTVDGGFPPPKSGPWPMPPTDDEGHRRAARLGARILVELSPWQRLVWVLSLDGFKPAEIADVLTVLDVRHTATVRGHLRDARRRARPWSDGIEDDG